MPRKGPHRYDRGTKAEYERAMARKQAINRLALALDYEGPVTNRGVPTALGDFILQRWRTDDSASSYEKVERLLDALQAHPDVAEREIDSYLPAFDDAMEGLTHQERRGLYFASQGFQLKHVAVLDGVTEDAVKARLTRARRKLHAVNTAHAVAIAIRKGLLWT
jgi:DNA-binding CsgD family transcriptional regulator